MACSTRSMRSCLILLSFACAVTACGLWKTPAKPRPKPKETVQYRPSEYVDHLSFAVLAYADAAPDTAAAAQHMKILEEYTAAPKSKKKARPAAQQPVAVVECKEKAANITRRLAVSLSGAEQESFTSVLDGMKRLSCDASGLSVAQVTVRPNPPLSLGEADVADTRQALQHRMNALLASGTSLSTINDAETQLRLMRMFVDMRERDAAYLAAENVKRLLAAETAPQNKETVARLLAEFEAAEKDMHRTLPYTF